MVYFVIDRWEGDFAVCENQTTKTMVNILRSLIDSSAREGDVIYLENGVYKVSALETKKAKDDIFSLLQKNKEIES